MTSTLTLGADEARALAAFCNRNVDWAPTGAARVVLAGSALGVFTVTPWEVMAFMAVPVAQVPEEPVDLVVSVLALANALSEPGALDLASLATARVTPGSGITLLDLPPREGWQMPMHALAGDLSAKVEAGYQEVQTRAAVFGPRDTDLEVRRWWATTGWSGISMGALFAAQQLGMLPKDQSKVAAATNGPWKRLSTGRGQVFTYATGPASEINLALLYPNGRP